MDLNKLVVSTMIRADNMCSLSHTMQFGLIGKFTSDERRHNMLSILLRRFRVNLLLYLDFWYIWSWTSDYSRQYVLAFLLVITCIYLVFNGD